MSVTPIEVQEWTSAINSTTDPNVLSELYIKRAQAFDIGNLPENAVSDYLTAITLTDNAKMVCHCHAMIALNFAKCNEKEQAVWWALKSIEADPDNDEGFHVLGICCSMFELYHNAVRAFEIVLRLRPSHSIARLELARALRDEGKHELAIAEFRQFIEGNPTNHRAYFELAKTLFMLPWSLNRSLEIKELCERAVSLNPDLEFIDRVSRMLIDLDAVEQRQ